MTDEHKNPWQTLKSALRFENPWIRVVQNDVINPSGGNGEYTVVHFKSQAVAVIPLDDEENTWLVGQYRYAMDSFEWEVPEGGAPEGESPLECAKRELSEETGLSAKRWDTICSGLQLSNSITDERAYTFLARDLTQHEASPEETEQLQLRKLPLSEAIDMALNGEINDAFSIVSLLRLQHFLSREQN